MTEQLSVIFNLSKKFVKIFFLTYFKALLKPALIGFIGTVAGAFVLFFGIGLLNSIVIILGGLILASCLSYAVWKGCLATYALNYAAVDFLKSAYKKTSFQNYLETFKLKEKDFIMYLAFSALVLILLHFPFFYIELKQASLTDLLSLDIILKNKKILTVFILNTLLLAPFINFSWQAYFFKKDNENYFNLFLNCYRKLDLTGAVIAIFITFFLYALSFNPVLSILMILLLPVIFSINMFWYYSRM